MGANESDLIARWQRGEAGAFEAIVHRWQEPIGRFLYQMIGQAESAKDLCQEVFLRAYRAGPKYRLNGAFSTWLYTIALNLARDRARRERHRPGCAEDLAVVDRTPQAEALCQQKETSAIVNQAISELAEPLREVLVLRHYQGMNFEEIARLTRTPASTLKSRFTAALAQLRGRLAKAGLGPEEQKT